MKFAFSHAAHFQKKNLPCKTFDTIWYMKPRSDKYPFKDTWYLYRYYRYKRYKYG